VLITQDIHHQGVPQGVDNPGMRGVYLRVVYNPGMRGVYLRVVYIPVYMRRRLCWVVYPDM